MPLQSIRLKPGVNRENTRLNSEGGWYESDKIRFRQGTPEVIGGWTQLLPGTFLGVCRSLWTWITLGFIQLVSAGTHLKFYIIQDSVYNDITPIRLRSSSVVLNDPFTVTTGSFTVTVADIAHGAEAGDWVTFTGSADVGGVPALDLNKQHQIATLVSPDAYTITVDTAATGNATGGGTVNAIYAYYLQTLGTNPFAVVSGSTKVTVTAVTHGALVDDFVTFSGAAEVGGLTIDGEYQVTGVLGTGVFTITAASASNATASGGGSAVTAAYQINTGPSIQTAESGWGAGSWAAFEWNSSTQVSGNALRVWSQSNYGEDLVFCPRGGGIYYWTASNTVSTRAIGLNFFPLSNYVPSVCNIVAVSDTSRFIIAFGCNELDQTVLDPMLIRWSDQENSLEWYPAITNQAGGMKLSNGSAIVAVQQARQEFLVFTNSALYSMQYIGAPIVWSFTLLESNTSCTSQNGVVTAAGVTYWMGTDKFYKYDGRVQTLKCDLRAFVFDNINKAQLLQVCAATNERFNEIWWFYCSAASTSIDSYVVYNYFEEVWYYGTMARSAWLDTGLNSFPIAATYSNNIVQHENGVDDVESGTPAPINAYIVSAQFDIGDGHNFSFIWRLLPDITFAGSTTGTSPSVVMSLLPLQNSGSGYTVPPSVAWTNEGTVYRIGNYTVDQFTGQINTRIRARQMSNKIESETVGTTWQLGSPRVDLRPDGRA
jgi:hypothetical protein